MSKQECYRKQHEYLSRLLEKAGEAIEDLDDALLSLQMLSESQVADADGLEAEVTTKLIAAHGILDKLITGLSTLEGEVWQNRSPTAGLMQQEVEAWQKSHASDDWYAKDFEKH